MTLPWKTCVQTGLCAVAVLGTGWVQAQSANHHPQQSQPVPVQAAPAPLHPATVPAQPAKKAHHPQKSSSGKYATPQQHEAAAVGQERRQGTGPSNPAHANQMSELQRNALRRCEIFKTNDDRMACVERVRQPQISGSVEGGGLIREYTQTVRVEPAPMPVTMPAPMPAPAGQYQAPQPQPHPHLVHPPVQPIRPQ